MNDLIPIERTPDGALVVASTTIAQHAEVQHKNVLELVRDNVEDFEEFGTVAFETRPLPGGGKPQQIAQLNEQQATLLLTYMRNSAPVRRFKKGLVRAFYAMAQQITAKPKTIEEMTLEVMGHLTAQVEAQQQQLEAALPKAEAFDDFLSSEGDYSINEAAKVLARRHEIEIGEGRLRALLTEWRWVYRRAGRPAAMQTQVKAKRMGERAQWRQDYKTGKRIAAAPQVRITPKGIDDIARRIRSTSAAVA